MLEATPDTFQDEVVIASARTPVIVMFHAAWCGPCKSIKPMIERLAAELPFRLVGVDGGLYRELAAQEGVRNVPTLMAYRGERLGLLTGANTEAQIRSFLAAAGVPA